MSLILKAQKREQFGSAEARRIMKSGLIPAVVYSKQGNINLSIGTREFEQEYMKGLLRVSLIELELGDRKLKVIAHKIEVDPVSDRPTHIEFIAHEDGSLIKAKPKFVFLNKDKSPGMKKGGILHIVLRHVEVICDNKKCIPETIEIDIGSMHIGQKIRSTQIKLPDGVKFTKKGAFLIASIIGRGKSEEETAAASAAATPADGSAPAPAAAAGAAKPAEDKKSDKKSEKK